MSPLFVVFGFVLMVFGADYFVKGAVNIANRLGLPPLIIGLTIVAWGTSMPELAVSLSAAGKDADEGTGLALGNVIGSNIANVFLIGGVGALMLPLACPPKQLRRDALWLTVATIFTIFIGALGQLTAWFGALLIGLLIVQATTLYLSVKEQENPGIETPSDLPASGGLFRAMAIFLGGLVAVVFGSELLVSHAILIAQQLQISGAVIGVTMVAVGTSLPELVTTIAAARQGQRDVIIGNIVGSNIANIVLVLGAVSLIAPGNIPSDLLDGDLWVMALSSGVFLSILLAARTINRFWALIFLGVFALYVAWQFKFFGLL